MLPWMRLSLVLVAGLPTFPLRAAEDPAALAAELARLRQQVETLTTAIDAEKEGLKTELRALETQKTDLALQIQKEELRVRQLEHSLAERRRILQTGAEAGDALAPTVRDAIGRIREAVEAGLPFKRGERLADLETLRQQLDDGLVAPIDTVARLWERVEDELRLARETGLYQQVVDLGGEKVLADVAKVGMVMLFFRTKDGRYGHAVRDAKGQWSYRVLPDEADRKQVAAFFDALKKQIRVGFFELPGALVPSEIQTASTAREEATP